MIYYKVYQLLSFIVYNECLTLHSIEYCFPMLSLRLCAKLIHMLCIMYCVERAHRASFRTTFDTWYALRQLLINHLLIFLNELNKFNRHTT